MSMVASSALVLFLPFYKSCHGLYELRSFPFQPLYLHVDAYAARVSWGYWVYIVPGLLLVYNQPSF